MRRIFALLLFAFGAVALSACQPTPSDQANAAPPAKSSAAVKAPKAIKTPEPGSMFYAKAKQKAVFTVQVGTDGLVHDPVLVQSCGDEQADASALEAVSRWKFKPATRDGIPVPISIHVEINLPPH